MKIDRITWERETYYQLHQSRMCSVAGEMLAAYSPPSYYFPCRIMGGSRPASTTRRLSQPKPQPTRPILVLTSSAPEETRTKKKVVFADDRGLSLTQVRMMTEPSNLPPSWSSQFISFLTKDSAQTNIEPWETTFPQPASDYIEFKRRLDEENISLENVFLKESEGVAIGTVKVKNISFEKEVVIRVTYDQWESFEDIVCTYVSNSLSSSSVTVLYDTFSFRLPLRKECRKIEFCVCYKSGGEEYWDNNKKTNYILVNKMVGAPSITIKSQPVPIPAKSPLKDVWSDYTSNWGVDAPYW